MSLKLIRPILILSAGLVLGCLGAQAQVKIHIVQQEAGKYGLWDRFTKDYRIPTQYDQLFYLTDCFHQPSLDWLVAKQDSLYGVVNDTGGVVYPFEYEAINGWCEGYIVLKKDGVWMGQHPDKNTLRGNTVVFCCPEQEANLPHVSTFSNRCNEKVLKYIKPKCKRPTMKGKYLLRGAVELSFIVEKDGSLSDIQFPRVDHLFFKKEIERVMETMPTFEPARHEGQIVRSRVMTMIYFGWE